MANGSSQDETLCGGGARIGIENLPGKVHHKFAAIDVEGDDPVVLVGSTNWTVAGAYDHDENTLIVHDRDLARACYAEEQRLWSTVPVERVCSAFEAYLPMIVRDWATTKIRGTAAPMPRLPTVERDVTMKA
jgi:phosphatidylserine/phosphatidylglycerophosphate/cardiolipin synthase-like enzyme